MRTTGVAFWSLAAALLAVTACDKKTESVPPVVLDAVLKIELPPETVSDRLVPVTYTAETGPGFQAPDCVLTQFVHFVDEKGKKLFQDDHEAEPKSGTWKPGEKLQTTRLLVLPVLEKETPFHVLTGLYCVDRPGQPFSVSGTAWREGEYRYKVASGTMKPFVRPLSDELVGFEGWYSEEYDIPQRLSWRWMGKTAKLILANRAQDSLLFLEGRLPKEAGTGPVTLRLVLGGKPLGQATTDAAGFVRAIYHLKPEDLGTESTVVLQLTVDQTFVPKAKGIGDGSDDRTLGLMMSKIHFGADTEATKALEPRPQQSAYTEPPAEAAPTEAAPAPVPADPNAVAPAAVPADPNAAAP